MLLAASACELRLGVCCRCVWVAGKLLVVFVNASVWFCSIWILAILLLVAILMLFYLSNPPTGAGWEQCV